MNNLHTLARLFVRTMAANLVMLVVIISFYAEPFSLVMDPFSWLGKLVTSGGLSNTSAALLFSATLLCDACKWRRVLSLLSEYRFGRLPGVRMLGRMVLIGFLLMAFPCDKFVYTHSVGAGLVVGGFWALTTGMLYYLRNKLGLLTHIGLQLILHISAIFCGANFVADTSLKGFSQRPLIISIVAETGICLNTLIRFKKATAWHATELRSHCDS